MQVAVVHGSQALVDAGAGVHEGRQVAGVRKRGAGGAADVVDALRAALQDDAFDLGHQSLDRRLNLALGELVERHRHLVARHVHIDVVLRGERQFLVALVLLLQIHDAAGGRDGELVGLANAQGAADLGARLGERIVVLAIHGAQELERGVRDAHRLVRDLGDGAETVAHGVKPLLESCTALVLLGQLPFPQPLPLLVVPRDGLERRLDACGVPGVRLDRFGRLCRRRGFCELVGQFSDGEGLGGS